MSKLCQTYNKDVYLSDNCHHRSFLNGIRAEINMVDQWTLVIVANKVCTFYIFFYFVMTMMT